MDHELTIREKIAEQYLLGELDKQRRDEFEEHFFDCSACADDVRVGLSFIENAKAVWREQPQAYASVAGKPAKAGFRDWFRLPVLAPYALAASLAGVVAYQSAVVIPAYRTFAGPQFVVSTALRPETRGAVQHVLLPAGAKLFELTVDLNTSAEGVPLNCEFQDAVGKPVIAMKAAQQAGGTTLNFLLPTDRFTTGDYQLVISGGAGSPSGGPPEIARYRFAIEKK